MKITAARNLVFLREAKNISRAELACAIGVSTSAVAMYERGERLPRDEIKVKIAEFYGESVGAIFFGNQLHKT